MRTSYGNKILLADDGGFLGVSLGADYCAEHEWGIEPMRSAFGIQTQLKGVEKRRVTTTPDTLIWVTDPKTKMEGIFWTKYKYEWTKPEEYLYNHSSGRDSNLPVSGWGKEDFLVASDKPEQIEKLKELFEAFKRQDVAIWLGGGGVFSNSGLCFGIVSRFPADLAKKWQDIDEETEAVQKAFDASGIEEILKKAGKRYFALSPRRDNSKEAGIVMWLNPMEQDKHNYGWFDLNELRQWAKDEGPIPMKKTPGKGRRR